MLIYLQPLFIVVETNLKYFQLDKMMELYDLVSQCDLWRLTKTLLLFNQ